MNPTVWLVLGTSESGDNYAAVFHEKPSTQRLDAIALGWDGTEERDGPGRAGSYVHLTVTEEEVKW